MMSVAAFMTLGMWVMTLGGAFRVCEVTDDMDGRKTARVCCLCD